MKKCKKCLSQLEDNVNFCSECGSDDFEFEVKFINQEVKVCKACNNEVSMGSNFCSYCGGNDFEITEKLVPVEEAEEVSSNQAFNTIKDKTVEKLKVGKQESAELFNAIKNDVSKSEFLKMTKEKAKNVSSKVPKRNKTGKIKKVLIVLVAIIVVALGIAVSCIHRCDNCEEIFFGEKHTYDFYGDEYVVCDDCRWEW